MRVHPWCCVFGSGYNGSQNRPLTHPRGWLLAEGLRAEGWLLYPIFLRGAGDLTNLRGGWGSDRGSTEGIHADGTPDVGARTPKENLSADEQNLSPAGSLAARPSLELALWDLLDAAARGNEHAKRRCQELKLDWQRKDEVLGYLQRGALIRWLDDHPDVRDGIVLHYGPPITREWFQYIAPVIEDDQAADAKAQATPERVEIHLFDLPHPSVVQFCSPSGYRVMILFPPNAARQPIPISADRVEIHLPDTIQQWRPEDVEAMRDWPVVVFPANTEASWEQARGIAQRLQGVAASIRLIDMANPRGHIQNEIAAGELWGFRRCRCEYSDGAHWTIGDEHFRNYCKKHQSAVRMEGLRSYKARDSQTGE